MDPFDKWLSAGGWVKADLSDSQLKTLKASFDALTPSTPPVPVVAKSDPLPDPEAAKLAVRAAAAEEQMRVAAVKKKLAGHDELQSKAIAEAWSDDKIELEKIKAERAQAPSFHIGNGGTQGFCTKEVLQCAAERSLNMKVDEAKFDDKTLQAAHTNFRGVGLQGLILAAARANGYTGAALHAARITDGNLPELLKYATGHQSVCASSFSTVDLTGILGAVANKSLLQSFFYVEQAWREFAAIASNSNFHTHTRYRLNGDGTFLKVSPGGTIQNMEFGEESFTNKIDTYAIMASLSRHDIINDDLGALTAIPQKMGRGAGTGLASAFFTELLDDQGTFFTSARGNYLSGATSALSSAGLKRATTLFDKQTDADEQPLGAAPEVLLVPPDLAVMAHELNGSAQVAPDSGSGSTREPTVNVWNGRFRVVKSVYLTNTAQWYLVANPLAVPLIEVAFLNGQQTPTLESGDVDFNSLGMQWRGYFDWGVSKQDYRGGLLANGS